MRTFTRLTLVGAASALLIAGFAAPAQAQATEYSALGDSYASGLGTREYFDEDCKKSNLAYPALIADANGYALDFAACSGAKVPDVANNQLGGLSDSTGRVTLSVGGNDIGWGDVVASCAKPWPYTCWGDIDEAERKIREELPGALDGLYGEVRAAAPNAQVAIVGYPRLFNETDECNAISRISPEEQVELNDGADLLSDTIAGVAANHGFDYVDVRDPFTGHAVCDDPEWINGTSDPIDESYHPNRDGHASGYAPAVGARL
ncbi:MAG: SGNH/GDSL hydrolase family protein [Stackebrandtia sp.]